MQSGNLQSAAGRIQEALEDLQLAWQHARESWRDERAANFEEVYINHIIAEVNVTIPAVSNMSQSMMAAVRECDE